MTTKIETGSRSIFNSGLIEKRRIHRVLWLLMVGFISAGLLISPIFGWLALGCMAGPVILSVTRGRYWCGWICPRGSFYENVVGLVRRKRSIPGWLKLPVTRWGLFSGLMTFMAYRLIQVWGDLAAMGGVLLNTVIVTTIVGIVLGLVYHRRSWCAICPMGTLASVIGSGKQLLTISSNCVSCKLCTTACPSEIPIANYSEEGLVNHPDCMKCQQCVTVCKRNALCHPVE